MPAGRLDPGEELVPALMREIEEESGLAGLRLLRELPGFEEHYPTRYENHGFHLVPTQELPDEWDHVVQGDGDGRRLRIPVPLGGDRAGHVAVQPPQSGDPPAAEKPWS